MRAVDTNVLIRLITRDDDQQLVAAESFVSEGAWVSHLVLAETMWVPSEAYGLDHDQVATTVDMLLNHQDLTLQDADVVAAALDHYRPRRSLGFSDCLVLEMARKAGHSPLGTFDKHSSRLRGAERL